MTKSIISDRDVDYLLASRVRVNNRLNVQVSSPSGRKSRFQKHSIQEPLEPNEIGSIKEPPDESAPFTREDFLRAFGKASRPE